MRSFGSEKNPLSHLMYWSLNGPARAAQSAARASATRRVYFELGAGTKSPDRRLSSLPTNISKPRSVATISPCRKVGSRRARSIFSFLRSSAENGSAFRLRALATNSSVRRRASSIRRRHSSCDRLASAESVDSCARQRAGAASRQMISRAATGAFIFRHHDRPNRPSPASNRRAGSARQAVGSYEGFFSAAANASFSLALS